MHVLALAEYRRQNVMQKTCTVYSGTLNSTTTAAAAATANVCVYVLVQSSARCYHKERHSASHQTT